jgi:hypothetical protein
MLGSSLLVNIKNQQSNFNGTQELNDDDVKNGYHVMRTYFIDENYSNAIDPVTAGLEAAGKIAESGGKRAQARADIYKTFQESRNKKLYGGQELASKRESSKTALIDSVLKAKQANLESQTKKQELNLKNKKTVYIIGGSILALTVLGLIIYKIKNK